MLDLFHPVQGNLLPWAEPDESGIARGLFTIGHPTPRQAEIATQAGIGLFPANVEGVLAFAELLATGGKPSIEYIRLLTYPRVKAIPEEPKALREFLGREAYALLCACAAYPRLGWNLTLYLAGGAPQRSRLADGAKPDPTGSVTLASIRRSSAKALSGAHSGS